MSGDNGKCDELVVSNLRLVYSMARKRCRPYIREDAAQEAALKLWRAAKFYDPKKTKFSTFAGTCIDRRLIDVAKVEGRRAEHFRPFSLECPEAQYTITPLDEIVKKEEQEFIEKLHIAVKKLPLYERFVITFHYGLYGEAPHSMREISELMKVPFGTARTIEQRAYQKLRVALEECA
jgi:RNA polymerase sigma factor (sigma-70 family)